ncbi:hypothetical protein Q4489_09705 [Thalassotalea sp. 1_MG-2023]|uniref:hypothetical protein n=1 Tax=Thalassotalea sp. 1_MG-2023 TaxID=3062680 RepID=UPI0026E416CF|nr:hypothetical protein [Thalassotalea sp. 1_MG-2023]MDO6427288.1 hypothetical protein [Thalassotalea sp. 1_MG-2023]
MIKRTVNITELTRLSHYQLTTIIGIFGIAIALVFHLLHFYFADLYLFGYQVLLAPRMFALNLFTEELSYKIKMLLLLSGQFIGYATGFMAGVFIKNTIN